MDHIKHRLITDEERSEIEFISRNAFYLNQQPQSIRNCFNEPKLLYWCGSYVIQQMKYGIIKDSFGIPYQVAFFSNLTRGQILANPNGQYALSFRRPKPEFNLSKVVLIKGAENV